MNAEPDVGITYDPRSERLGEFENAGECLLDTFDLMRRQTGGNQSISVNVGRIFTTPFDPLVRGYTRDAKARQEPID